MGRKMFQMKYCNGCENLFKERHNDGNERSSTHRYNPKHWSNVENRFPAPNYFSSYTWFEEFHYIHVTVNYFNISVEFGCQLQRFIICVSCWHFFGAMFDRNRTSYWKKYLSIFVSLSSAYGCNGITGNKVL